MIGRRRAERWIHYTVSSCPMKVRCLRSLVLLRYEARLIFSPRVARPSLHLYMNSFFPGTVLYFIGHCFSSVAMFPVLCSPSPLPVPQWEDKSTGTLECTFGTNYMHLSRKNGRLARNLCGVYDHSQPFFSCSMGISAFCFLIHTETGVSQLFKVGIQIPCHDFGYGYLIH